VTKHVDASPSSGHEVSLKVVNGWAVVPVALLSPDNLPRFRIEFPANLGQDIGARHLVTHELQGGYERATRNLLEKVLQPGDLFIDVGAHWGVFTLQAVTHPAGNIRALAFEPDPTNAGILFHNILANGVAEAAQAVCAACGEGDYLAPLVTNSSMMHSIRGVGLKPPYLRGPSLWVSVVAVDGALEAFPQDAGRRVILKVDAEGLEPQVLAGADRLLAAGRAPLVVWERGEAFADGPERSALIEMLAALSRRGFSHFRPPGEHDPGPCVPFRVEEAYVGNVFSVLEQSEVRGLF
jgi:FkbM family methyltransferase